jgi:hypothetical protein
LTPGRNALELATQIAKQNIRLAEGYREEKVTENVSLAVGITFTINRKGLVTSV